MTGAGLADCSSDGAHALIWSSASSKFTCQAITGSGAAGLLTSNNVWSGVNTYSSSVTVANAGGILTTGPIVASSATLGSAGYAVQITSNAILPGATFYSGGPQVFSGNVGIGTTSPQHTLDVNGAMYSRRYGATNGGSSSSIDWSKGNVQSLTLSSGGNTLSFSNGQDGGKYILILKQPASGAAGTVTWPSGAGGVRWASATAATLTTTNGKVDYLGFIYNGGDSKYDGVASMLNF
jgi:hypothetical protein